MRRRILFLSVMLLIMLVPTVCSAEWKLLDGKHHENTYGTKYYMDTKMNYADVSSTKRPIVVFWGKTVFNGKSDPTYVKLISNGSPSETAVVELKYKVDITNKKAAIIYGILYDTQGRILGTDEQKKAEYIPIPSGTGAEAVWLMIKELHEKGAIGQ